MSRRILLAVLTVTSLAIVAFFVPAALAIRSAHERGELLELQREASIVASRVPATGELDERSLEPIVGSEHRIGLYDPSGRLLGGIGPDPADRIVTNALAGDFAEGRVGDDLVAAVAVRALVDGSDLAVRIEAPRSDSRGRFLRSLAELAAAAAGVLVVAGAIGAYVARRVNRPIDELRRWAAAADPDAEPPPPTGMVELDALRDEVITSRERIAALLRRERAFSSHVSHQLRTPVAALRVAIETEQEAPRPDASELLDEAIGQLDRLESTITGLLQLARHDDRPTTTVDVLELVRQRTDAWERSASAVQRRVRVEGAPTRVRTDAEAVAHIVDVLVENAIRHGSGTVDVRVGAAAGVVTIDVGDEGPAPDPAALAGRSDSGHGIGLQLATALATSLGGSIDLRERPTTTMRLSIPIDD